MISPKIGFSNKYFYLTILFRITKGKYFDYGHISIHIRKLKHPLHCESNLFVYIINGIFKIKYMALKKYSLFIINIPKKSSKIS